jgi:hypothetical protein
MSPKESEEKYFRNILTGSSVARKVSQNENGDKTSRSVQDHP